MKRIWLFAHDMSDGADKIAEHAAQELERDGGHLTLLHVYRIPAPPSLFNNGGTEVTFMSSQELSDALSMQFQQRLTKLAARLTKSHPKIHFETLVQLGDAVDEILHVARDIKAERIVVGTHSRKGVEYFLLGSIAEKVVRLAPCSVLVMKQSKHV